MYLKGEGLVGGYTSTTNILDGCTIEVERGSIAVIVGPNGAGKSTAMRALLGMLNLQSGSVTLNGADITSLTPQARVALGMAFVPQTSNVFGGMTVEQNLEMGAFLHEHTMARSLSEVYDLFPILYEKRFSLAGELSGGQRQQVAIGRAMMTDPTVLMLDEPTAGISPIVMDELFTKIVDIRNLGMAILIVEQNARQALSIADVGYVLVQGQNRYEGSGSDLFSDPEVSRSFLGGVG